MLTAFVTRALSKPRKVSHAYKTTKREQDKKNPEVKQYENLPKKFPIILGFLRSNFVAKFLDI